MAQSIVRVDTIPLIIAWLEKMGIRETIDTVFPAHRNWNGLSFGRLAVFFVTYVLHKLTHRLYGMEPWLNAHKSAIERATGWRIGEKDATDDRLGRMLDVFGEDDDKISSFQLQSGKRIVSAYELPTETARYDTTSYSVFHESNDSPNGILEFGHSKDKRPDLLQFKQGLGVLDPAGIPLVSDTLPGNRADDRCYVPAWRRMVETVGKPDFLFIADCKAASMHAVEGDDRPRAGLLPVPPADDGRDAGIVKGAGSQSAGETSGYRFGTESRSGGTTKGRLRLRCRQDTGIGTGGRQKAPMAGALVRYSERRPFGSANKGFRGPFGQGRPETGLHET